MNEAELKQAKIDAVKTSIVSLLKEQKRISDKIKDLRRLLHKLEEGSDE